MAFYLQTSGNNPAGPFAVWQVDATEAKRIDVTESPSSQIRAEPGQDALKALREHHLLAVAFFHELELSPGEYYPGMARPVAGESLGRNQDRSDSARNQRTSTTGQLHALVQQLEQICRVVQPIDTNLQAFGHEIRNVLILACTEVEAQWKAILKANAARAESTKDYVQLALPMRLSEYSVDFPYYPWMSEIRPFENWRSATNTPTRDLRWYDAYNKIKHDRESNFKQASLDNAFQALAGFFVMLCGQYGWDFALTGDAASRAFLRLKRHPRWTFSEYYVPPYGAALSPKVYKFSS